MLKPRPLRCEVVGQPVVLHKSSELLLILGDDAEVAVEDVLSSLDGFAMVHIAPASCLHDVHGKLQSDGPVCSPPACRVTKLVVLNVVDRVAEEACRSRPGMRQQGLRLRQFELERLVEELTELLLDVLGFFAWTAEPKQKIVCVPGIA